jgi:hypothetical protein
MVVIDGGTGRMRYERKGKEGIRERDGYWKHMTFIFVIYDAIGC